tara:strand:- start:299 stop:1129 length:831 start_codon:yes stop_codon:yes gene_type:complete
MKVKKIVIDKIYVLTLGRPNKQITFDNFPKSIQDITTLVVQPQEEHLFPDYPKLVLPEDDIGIVRTRKWIYDYAKNQKWGMFDDDLIFKRRTQDWKFPQSPNEENVLDEEGWNEVLEKTSEWFDSGFSFAGFRRGVLPPFSNGQEYHDCTESICAVFGNGPKLPDSNDLVWNFDLLSEDVHFVLQMLLLGHKNRVWDKYIYENKWAQPGGVSYQRTVDILDRSHEKLIELYPDYVKWRKEGDDSHIQLNSGSEYDGVKLIQILWDKAYNDSKIQIQ